MALRDTWHRALVYFGLAEDPEYHEPDLYEPETGTHAQPTRSFEGAPRGSVSRLGDRRRSQDEIDDIFADDAPAPRARSLRPVGNGGGDVRVHLVNPHSFNDAQEVADRFKDDVPVILNLQTTEAELAKRLIDFASGLTYALDGGMQKVAEKTFMLTPRNVEVSAEQKAQLVEKGFFNQS
jgi:cell division inhibitor SepF